MQVVAQLISGSAWAEDGTTTEQLKTADIRAIAGRTSMLESDRRPAPMGSIEASGSSRFVGFPAVAIEFP